MCCFCVNKPSISGAMIFLLRMNLKRNARNMRIRAFELSRFWKGIQVLIFATVSGLYLKITWITVQNAPKYPFF